MTRLCKSVVQGAVFSRMSYIYIQESQRMTRLYQSVVQGAVFSRMSYVYKGITERDQAVSERGSGCCL